MFFSVSAKKDRGRKYVRKDRAKAYRTINVLKIKVTQEKRRSEKLRKRLQRIKNKCTLTPRSKTKKLIRGSKIVNPKVKRTLLFHNVLLVQLKDNVRNGQRNLMKNVLLGKIIKKYKFGSTFSAGVGISRHLRKATKQKQRIHALVKKVKDFLERDENSCLGPGKKDCITRKKVKKQKRYLCFTMKHLHQKYLQETREKISYSLFCRMQPFWVVTPVRRSRDTCMCITHENIKLKIDKLKQLKIITLSNVPDLIKLICCDDTSQKCMYRQCADCKDMEIVTNEFDESEETFVYQWRQTTQTYQKQDSNVVSYKITAKEKVVTSKGELVKKFQSDLQNIGRHIYNIYHQHKEFRTLKENLTDKDVCIHKDFSKNFVCGYAAEVQSAHFGGSHRQATLHTGVAYHTGTVHPFCTISDSTCNDPAAIWAHLGPVLLAIRRDKPKIERIHVISDGPTTQYRNRKNMYLFSSCLYQLGFTFGTWNFSEVGHRKGAPEGVGGVLKRVADRLIAEGNDIPNADILFNKLKENTSISLHYITSDKIEEVEKTLPNKIPCVSGIMKVHQCITIEKVIISTRILSCFCSNQLECQCFTPVRHQLVESSLATDWLLENENHIIMNKSAGNLENDRMSDINKLVIILLSDNYIHSKNNYNKTTHLYIV